MNHWFISPCTLWTINIGLLTCYLLYVCWIRTTVRWYHCFQLLCNFCIRWCKCLSFLMSSLLILDLLSVCHSRTKSDYSCRLSLMQQTSVYPHDGFNNHIFVYDQKNVPYVFQNQKPGPCIHAKCCGALRGCCLLGHLKQQDEDWRREQSWMQSLGLSKLFI